MNLQTFLALLQNNQITAFRAAGKAASNYHRVAFLAAGLRSGWLRSLAEGPVPLDTLMADFSSCRSNARAWRRGSKSRQVAGAGRIEGAA